MNLRQRATARMRQQKSSEIKRDGATLVEFAIVAPVFFLILFASFEFVRLSMIRNLVQDAAYFAARDAMVPGASAQEAEATANRILGFMNTQGAQITINNGNGLSDDSESVIVSISVPVSQNSLLVPKYSSDINFSATATLRTERYHGYYSAD